MALPSELVSAFVEVTNDQTEIKQETTVRGTIVEHDGTKRVRIDGSDLLTPISTTVDVKEGDRVTVLIKDHKATVTGDTTAPAARNETVTELGEQVNGRITAEIAEIDKLYAKEAEIDELVAGKIDAEMAEIDKLYVKEAEVDELVAGKIDAEMAEIDKLYVKEAEVDELVADKVKAETAEIEKAIIESLDAEYANIDFANIGDAAIENFFAKSGMVDDLVVSDGRVTGTLVGVTIIGDLIKGGTVQADKLVIKGEDGLYYKLNVEGGATVSEQVSKEDLQNGLSGSIIVAKSITAEKVAVDDLVAFGATIGGFHITSDSLYSGVKESVDNTTRGIYQDTDGQFAVGDASNFLKFYKDTDGTYKLAISAASMTFSSSGRNVEETIKDEVNKVEVGGRNLLLDTKAFGNLYTATAEIATETYNGFTVRHHQNSTDEVVESVAWSGVKLEKYGQQLTFSFWAKGSGQVRVLMARSTGGVLPSISETSQGTITYNQAVDVNLSSEWTRYWVIWTIGTSGDLTLTNWVSIKAYASSEVYVCGAKLETGNKATDWTPAPEDMATSNDIENVSEANRETNKEVAGAYSLIQQLSDSIAMLVTDENGASLMTQTADGGWTFSMAETSKAVSDISGQLGDLQKSTGDTDATVKALDQAVKDIGATMEYVRITVYEDEPCIELGESDSDYSLMITNTRIMFRVASGVPTLINANGLVTDNIEVNNNLKQGYWTWRERKNGNLGLRWQYTGIQIITQPQDLTLAVGETGYFSLVARGLGLTYLWRFKNPGEAWGTDTAEGYNGSVCTRTVNNTSIDGQLVHCVIRDKYGNSVTSNTVTLTVTES